MTWEGSVGGRPLGLGGQTVLDVHLGHRAHAAVVHRDAELSGGPGRPEEVGEELGDRHSRDGEPAPAVADSCSVIPLVIA